MKLTLLLLAAAAAFAQQQPVPYSHKLHAGDLKLKCATCHPNPDPGEAMTLPAPAVCGGCHKGKYDREIKWAPVYTIPSFVYFSHRTHIQAGNTCEDCHGPVATRTQLTREKDLTMGSCMNCHREKNASTECTFCHEQQ